MRNLGRWIAGVLVVGTLWIPLGFHVHAVEPLEGEVIEQPVFEDSSTLVVDLFFPPGTSVGQHAHFDPAIIHVLSGTLTFVFPDGDRRILALGEAVMVPARSIHAFSNNGMAPCRVRLILLKMPPQLRGM